MRKIKTSMLYTRTKSLYDWFFENIVHIVISSGGLTIYRDKNFLFSDKSVKSYSTDEINLNSEEMEQLYFLLKEHYEDKHRERD